MKNEITTVKTEEECTDEIKHFVQQEKGINKLKIANYSTTALALLIGISLIPIISILLSMTYRITMDILFIENYLDPLWGFSKLLFAIGFIMLVLRVYME